MDSGPFGGGNLVTHQREQRRNDHCRPRSARPEQRRGDEVDGGLAPAGALDDESPAARHDESPDGTPLVVAEPCLVAGERSQAPLCLLPDGNAVVGGRLVLRSGVLRGGGLVLRGGVLVRSGGLVLRGGVLVRSGGLVPSRRVGRAFCHAILRISRPRR